MTFEEAFEQFWVETHGSEIPVDWDSEEAADFAVAFNMNDEFDD